MFIGIWLPFLGTALGSACVFLLRRPLGDLVQRGLTGFASGVMVAAAVWSLLIPAMEQGEGQNVFPVVTGFWLGILFLLLLDHITPHLHRNSSEPEGPRSGLKDTTKLMLAVTLHNIPEGMAVGVVYAGAANTEGAPMAGALALSLGIALQNFPEGANISLPLRAAGESRGKAFAGGVLSGLVEPAAALLTLLLAPLIMPVLPGFLSIAAGAMLYVVVEELIPEMSQGKHSNMGVLSFALGFSLMMALDVLLG